MGDLGLISGLGRSSGEMKGYPLQYFGLRNSMDCIVQRVAKNWTQLSDFHFHFQGVFKDCNVFAGPGGPPDDLTQMQGSWVSLSSGDGQLG